MVLQTDNSAQSGPLPYAQDTDGTGDLVRNTSRFGFTAMPESYGASGNIVFIINEGNTMFKRDFGQDVIVGGLVVPMLSGVWTPEWPTSQELKKHWRRVPWPRPLPDRIKD